MRNKLTQDRPTLFVDQWGNKIWASTLKELRDKCGVKTSAAKQYSDRKDGTYWTGYVIGDRWFTAFNPAAVPA